MGKIAAVLALFRAGNAVANPAAWKTGQITATALGAVIIAAVQLASSFGYRLPIDADSAVALAGGIIAFVNVVLTLTTSKTVGLGKASNDAMLPDDPAAPGAAQAGGITDPAGGD